MARPKKYTTTNDINDKVISYLNYCKEKNELPNKAGLCSYLDITKETYCQYKKKDEFSDSIKRFENYTENLWVQRLGGNCPTGAIFYLKNAFREDWQDRHETDVTSGGLPIQISEAIAKKNDINQSTK